MGKKILIITPEFISYEGMPTGGLGIRIENLANGLKKNGHDIIFSFSKDNMGKLKVKPPKELIENIYDDLLDEVILKNDPDIIIFSPWLLLLKLNNNKIIDKYPIVVDLPGSLVLENIYLQREKNLFYISEKIAALNKCDALICSNPYQKFYILSWLLLSGHSLKDNNIILTPISNSTDNSHYDYPEIPEYVFSGVLWPWQDYGNNLNIIAEYLSQNKGNLNTFCGSFLYTEKEKKLSNLDKYSSVKQNGLIGHNELLEHYKKASVAVELYLPNYERQLATTTRTLEYFSCGLPVIYSKDMYFSNFIQEYDAGWIIDPKNKDELLTVLQEINENPLICKEKGQNAKKIIIDKFNNFDSVKELSEYCMNPVKIKKNLDFFVYTSETLYNQSEIINNQSKIINSQKEKLEVQQKEFFNKIEEQKIKYRELLTNKDGLIEKLEFDNRYLKNDLERIISRLPFRIMLKIKKIFDKIF